MTGRWQGSTALEGDCPVQYAPGWSWLCTLDAGHDGPHEAWGTGGDEPLFSWQGADNSYSVKLDQDSQ